MIGLKTGFLAEPVLVGRERELAVLMRNLDLAFEGKGTAIFVSGEAGSGKTRLTNEFLTRAKEKEIVVLSGWCISNLAVPYFPFTQAFNTYFSAKKNQEEPTDQQSNDVTKTKDTEQIEDVETEIKTWLMGPKQTANSERLQNLTPQAWKELAVAAITKSLLSISTQKPIILFIDDLHWADSASLSLLHYISRSISAARVLVLTTFRKEELVPDSEGHPHPLLETLRLMRREDLFTEIELSNLNRTNVAALAEKMIGGSLYSELADKLAEESDGNPLFVVESLRMLAERGSLVQDQGRWRLSIDEIRIPTKIKDIILRRMGALKPNQRRVLDLASVIGEKFNVELLGAVLGQDSLEVLETLNSVAQSSSLVVSEGDFYRFDHAKSREALYEEISPPLRNGYHARIAERLETGNKDVKELPVNDLAYHYFQAGIKAKAVKYALAAGKNALARFSNTEAIEHFTHVLQNVEEDPANDDERTSALEGLGDAFYANSLFEEAAKTFERLANRGTGIVRLRAFRKAMDATFFQGEGTHLVELVEKAEKYAALDRLESARIRLNKGRISMDQHKTVRALEDFEGALRVFEEEYSLWDAAWALVPIGLASAIMGKPIEGLVALLRSIAIFNEVGDCSRLMDAYAMASTVSGFCGLRGERLEMLAKAVEIDEKMKMGNYNKLAHVNGSWSRELEVEGDLAGALSKSLKALEYSGKTDSERWLGAIYADLTRQYAKLGDLTNAEEYFKRLMKLPPQILSHRPAHFALTKAVFFATKNQWEESNKYFKEELEWLKTHPPATEEALIRVNFAWALDMQGRAEEARMQSEEVQQLFDKAEKKFEHANLHANLMARTKVGVGQTFDARLDIVNVSTNSGTIVRVEELLPPEFKVLQSGIMGMKERKIGPFQVETVKLTLQATEAGVFTLNPQVVYIDDLGETKTCKPSPVNITVQSAQPASGVFPTRITTGFAELDALLFGGIPESDAVILTSPSIDERALLVTKFLQAGANSREVTFYITVEAGNANALAKKYPSNFYLFVCNPQAEAMIQSQPNVFKLKGVESLTEIDIAITKALRTLTPSATDGKRICIEIVSDVLLQHHALITRKWLSSLLAKLKAKGFTTLAVIDPQMHPMEESRAIISLFDGEIHVSEKETPEGIKQTLRVRKLINQKYSDKEIALSKEALSD